MPGAFLAQLDASACFSASAQVSLNTVDNVDAFIADVAAGRWDTVLPQVRSVVRHPPSPMPQRLARHPGGAVAAAAAQA